MMKRKYMFRILACITAFVITLGLCNTSIQAEDITQTDEFLAIIEERRDEYLNDTAHLREAEEKGISIEELLYQDALAAYPMRVQINQDAEQNAGISLLDVGNNGQCLSTNVKLIQQTTTKNCGPTAVLQVLYGMSRQGAVAGSTDTEKIRTLMKDCNTDDSGTYIGNLVSCLNKYSTAASYRYTEGRTMTQAEFQAKLETSLCYNIAPILHAKTKELPYYGGHDSGHYIAVSEVNKTTGTVRLSDCNWNNQYFGVHTVSVEKAYQSIAAESWRYLIYMSY